MKKIILTALGALLLVGCIGCAAQSADDPLPTVKNTTITSTVPTAPITSDKPEPADPGTTAPITGTSPSPEITDVPAPGTTAQKPETGSDAPATTDAPETSRPPVTSKAQMTTTEALPEPEIPHTHSYTKADEKTTTATQNGQTVKTTTVTYICSCGESYTDTKTETVVENHTHSYTSKVTQAAACTDNGVMTYTCSCGDSYTQTIQATGHSWSKTKTVAPTCTAQGYAVYTCKSCKATYNDDYTAATGHKWSGWTVTKTATEQAEGEEARTCTACQRKETRTIAKLSHKHSYGAWTTVKAATCTAPGTQQRTCSCGDKQTQTIPATGHSWRSWTVTKAATCEAAGTQSRSCTKCGKTETKTIAAIGHNWLRTAKVASSGDFQGFEEFLCTKCKETYREYDSTWKPPEPEPEIKAPTEADLEEMAEYFLQLLNEERAKIGARQLVTGPILHEIAQARAEELTERFEHVRPDGRPVDSVWDEFQYGNYYERGMNYSYHDPAGNLCWGVNHYLPTPVGNGGEDIGGASYTGESFKELVEREMNDFKNSPGHWRDMTDDAYGAVGIAVSAIEVRSLPEYGNEDIIAYSVYFEVLLVDKLYE